MQSSTSSHADWRQRQFHFAAQVRLDLTRRCQRATLESGNVIFDLKHARTRSRAGIGGLSQLLRRSDFLPSSSRAAATINIIVVPTVRRPSGSTRVTARCRRIRSGNASSRSNRRSFAMIKRTIRGAQSRFGRQPNAITENTRFTGLTLIIPKMNWYRVSFRGSTGQLSHQPLIRDGFVSTLRSDRSIVSEWAPPEGDLTGQTELLIASAAALRWQIGFDQHPLAQDQRSCGR